MGRLGLPLMDFLHGSVVKGYRFRFAVSLGDDCSKTKNKKGNKPNIAPFAKASYVRGLSITPTSGTCPFFIKQGTAIIWQGYGTETVLW